MQRRRFAAGFMTRKKTDKKPRGKRESTQSIPRQTKKSSSGRLSQRLTGTVLIILLSLSVYYLPPFRMLRIEVSPTRAMTTESVRSAVPIKANQHIFQGLGPDLLRLLSLRYGGVESALAARFPYIRTVTARLSFPSAMIIEIEERIEVAYVAIPDGCVMLDKESYALRILPRPPADIPVIEGVSVTSLNLGEILTVDAESAMIRAVSTLSAIIDADKDTRTPQKLLTQIRKIRPLSDGRLFLTLALPQTGDELTVVVENKTDLLDDMLWLRFAMDQGALDDRGKGVLDLTGNRKVFIPDA